MTTIKDFKKWLDSFPEDTIVEFAFQEQSTGYESYGSVTFREPELEASDYGDGWAFVDFTKNQLVKPGDDLYGKRYLQIGEAN